MEKVNKHDGDTFITNGLGEHFYNSGRQLQPVL